jgi:PAS domain S-box-containing protein
MGESTNSDSKALHESEAMLRVALAATKQGLYDLDVRSGVATVTPEYLSMIGEDPSATTFHLAAFGQRIHPDDAVRVSEIVEAYTRGDTDGYREEFRIRHTSGEWIWILSIGRVVERDGDGRAVRVLGSHTDISDRKQAELELAQTRALLAATFEQSPVPMALASAPDGVFRIVNTAAAEFLGIRAADYVAKPLAEVDITWKDLMPDGRPYDLSELPMPRALGGVTTDPLEIIVERSDGSRRWELCVGAPVRDDAGSVIAGLIVFQDITERKAVQEALERSRLLLSASMESQRDTIMFSIDLEYRYLYYNKAHADAMRFAYGTDPEPGACIMDLITSDEDRIASKENYDRALAGESHTNVRVFGAIELAYYESFFNPIMNERGEIVGATGLARDITGRKKAEDEVRRLNLDLEQLVQERTEDLYSSNEELMAANEALTITNLLLEEARRVKDEFLAAMSHELRTPLNSIIGFSGVLSQELAGPLSDEQRKQIEMIGVSGRHLLELVNDILDLAKVESGLIEPTIGDADVGAVAREACDIVRPLGVAKRIEMELVCSDDLKPVRSDPSYIRQILLNLLGNAVRFTEEGRIRVTVSQDGSGVMVAVEDTGMGIAAHDMERIFEDYYQAAPPSGGKNPGTGLGLPISLRLATAIGAQIEVTSELGRGSTFTLHIPTQPR